MPSKTKPLLSASIMCPHGVASMSGDPIGLTEYGRRVAAEPKVRSTDEPTLAVENHRLDE